MAWRFGLDRMTSFLATAGAWKGFSSFLQYRESRELVVAVLANITTGLTEQLANQLRRSSALRRVGL